MAMIERYLKKYRSILIPFCIFAVLDTLYYIFIVGSIPEGDYAGIPIILLSWAVWGWFTAAISVWGYVKCRSFIGVIATVCCANILITVIVGAFYCGFNFLAFLVYSFNLSLIMTLISVAVTSVTVLFIWIFNKLSKSDDDGEAQA